MIFFRALQAVETLQQISDGSLDDVYLSGVPLTTIYPINVKEEPIDDYDYMPDTNDFDHNGTNDEKDSNNIPIVKSESKDPDWDHEGKLKSKEKSKKISSKKVQCEICFKTFNKAKILAKHKAKFHDTPIVPTESVDNKYKCKLCDKSYKGRKGLRSHVKSVHEKKRTSCEICNKSFVTNNTLKRHVEAVHEKIKKVKCEFCDKAFTQYSELTQHLFQRHDGMEQTMKQFKCQICEDVSFSKPKELYNHNVTVHKPETPSYRHFFSKVFLSVFVN